MQLKSWGVEDVAAFLDRAIDPPRKYSVDTALTLLSQMGALEVCKSSIRLTFYGYFGTEVKHVCCGCYYSAFAGKATSVSVNFHDSYRGGISRITVT